jgi:lipoprotein-anchoring transpeptidase ErfK/SrfK
MLKTLKKVLCLAAAAVLAAFLAVPAAAQAAATDAESQAVIDYIASLSPAAPQCQITYDFGNGRTYTVGPEMAMSMMKTNDDGSYYIDPATNYYVLDPNKMIGFFTSLTQKFQPTQNGADFTTRTGRYLHYDEADNDVRVIDVLKEVPYLSQAIMAQKTETHTPALSIGSTYVEVDLSNQKAYYYDNGTITWSSDIVSGNVSENNQTPVGVFAINKYMTKDTVLIGEGNSYQTPVSYWMPFVGNSVGLHDATWRSYFGGTIYKTNGSHGCVNLPPEKAKALYSLVSVGTPVIVH